MLAQIMEAVSSIQRFIFGRQLLLFDCGELTPRRAARQPIPTSVYEARKDRLRRLMIAQRRQRRIDFDCKPKRRKAKILSHWIWECPADLVDIIAPEIGEPLIKALYERAAMVRERMKRVRLKKANCYPVPPMVLDRLNTRDIVPHLNIRERFE